MLDTACGNKRHTYAERSVDLYETPEVAVEALLRAEKLPQHIWEPACGPGSIVKVLRSDGRNVFASDLIDYGCPDSHGDLDFLKIKYPPPVFGDAIVTNPPYKLAEHFVRHALFLKVPKICMLLRLAFLESERRRHILEDSGLARVHVFRKRLPMMHRAGWSGAKSTSAMAFAWFVWEHEHKGPTTLHRISWEKDE